jgi:hypothetical protein
VSEWRSHRVLIIFRASGSHFALVPAGIMAQRRMTIADRWRGSGNSPLVSHPDRRSHATFFAQVGSIRSFTHRPPFPSEESHDDRSHHHFRSQSSLHNNRAPNIENAKPPRTETVRDTGRSEGSERYRGHATVVGYERIGKPLAAWRSCQTASGFFSFQHPIELG